MAKIVATPLSRLQQESQSITDRLIKLKPPEPINPAVPGDDKRYEAEKARNHYLTQFWMKLKKEKDDLIYAIEMATNSEKRLKMVQVYQKLHAKSERAQALKAILAANKK